MGGRVERMDEGRAPRMAYVHREKGRRSRGRLQLRQQDCIERDMKRTELRSKTGECSPDLEASHCAGESTETPKRVATVTSESGKHEEERYC